MGLGAALQKKQSTKQALQDLNKKKASDSEIIAARKARYDAEQLTKDEVTRAVGFLDNAINARKGSHTRQEQAKAAIEQAQNTDASEAQLTRNRLAREAREAAARQAQETAVREAQDAAARQARQAQETAELPPCRSHRRLSHTEFHSFDLDPSFDFDLSFQESRQCFFCPAHPHLPGSEITKMVAMGIIFLYNFIWTSSTLLE